MIFVGTGACMYAVSQAATPVYYVATEPRAIAIPLEELEVLTTSFSEIEDAGHETIFQRDELPALSHSENSKELEGVTAPSVTSVQEPTPSTTLEDAAPLESAAINETELDTVFAVPFYSQFENITSPSWKKVGCGIASLAMLIDFHTNKAMSVDTLLQEGIDAGAYLSNAGWTYAGLIGVSKKHGLDGEAHDLGSKDVDTAFKALEDALDEGPVMVSVHYTFDPANPIPHLVILNGIDGETLYYNDPAEEAGAGSLSVEKFKKAWKKRYIEFYPVS